MAVKRREVLIWARDDALIVANDGRHLSRRGVLALCASDLTEKSEYSDDLPDDISGVSDDEFIHEIARRTINVYRTDPNRRKRDVRHEKAVSRDYGGRYLWELVQNADDAMAPEGANTTRLIGTKGLGFKSVLEISERPEIFSHRFAFRFTRSESELLLQKDLKANVAAPTFEIPHPATLSQEIEELLGKRYATIIRLPFSDAQTRAKVHDAVKALDRRFLLFSQHLERFRIRFDTRDVITTIKRSPSTDGRQTIALASKGDGSPRKQAWCKWSKEWPGQEKDKLFSVAVCLPMDDSGGVQPLAYHSSPIYVFFPTKERIGARALIHASIELTQNRNYFVDDEKNNEIYPRLKQLIANILQEVPAKTSLQAFGVVNATKGSELAQRLADSVTSAVKETPFVPTLSGTKVCPGKMTVWTGNFGTVLRSDATELERFNLVHPTVDGCNAILNKLGASYAQHELLWALAYCENSSLDACKKVIDVMFNEVLPRFKFEGDDYRGIFDRIPCWWTEGNFPRSIAGQRAFILERPMEWPAFVPADFLSSELLTYAKTIHEKFQVTKEKAAVSTECTISLFSRHKEDFFKRALLPALSKLDDESWNGLGWEALRWCREWCETTSFERTLPLALACVSDEYERDQLSHCLRLPTDKGWTAAGRCYADESWGASKSLKRHFSGFANRGVVRPLNTWDENAGSLDKPDAWKSLLRFAGVSWEPKLVTMHRFPNVSETEKGYRAEYLGPFNRQKFDIEIELFPDCLRDEPDPLLVIRAAQRLDAAATRYPAKYLRPHKQSSEMLETNFARYQLRAMSWLPHRGSLLYPQRTVRPDAGYLPGTGIEGLTPEVDIANVDLKEKARIIAFLTELGVHDSVPCEIDVWVEWLQRLTYGGDKREVFVASMNLYRKFLQMPFEEAVWRTLRIPCFVQAESFENVEFVWPENGHWLDDPVFAIPAIRQQILQRGYRIFILLLDQGAGSDRKLRIKRLSDVLTLLGNPEGCDEQQSKRLVNRYRARILALRALVSEGQRPQLRDDLSIRATHNLSIRIVDKAGKEIAVTSFRAFRGQDGVLLISAEDSYRALGLGLARYIIDAPRMAPAFENILCAKSELEVIERLREQGIPEQEIDFIKGTATTDEDEVSRLTQDDVLSIDEVVVPELDSSFAPTQFNELIATSDQSESDVPARERNTLIGGGSADLRAASEAGQHAERWFEGILRAAMPDWQIIRRERDAHNRESDFVLRQGKNSFHVEVKRIGSLPGTIYWSELEYLKADELGEQYCMAVLLESKSTYNVSWIWKPVVELARAERYIEWQFESKKSERLKPGSWEAPLHTIKIVPRSRMYRIVVSEELHQSFEADTSAVLTLRSRLSRMVGRNSEGA
jgi:hypothetical protein